MKQHKSLILKSVCMLLTEPQSREKQEHFFKFLEPMQNEQHLDEKLLQVLIDPYHLAQIIGYEYNWTILQLQQH